MKITNTLPNIKLIIATLLCAPFFTFGQLSAEAPNDFSEIEDETVKTTEEASAISAKVLDVKKMTRYSLAFVVELPSIGDVLTYMNENLGVDTQEADAVNDPNWSSNACTTRNFEVIQNDNGEFEVKVRFYPPADPINAEVQGIQRKSRIMCWEAFQQLKADASRDERLKF
ncbi:MAG: hypothetical protein AB8B56_00495 [Crocinitomicaceae bacterium]